MYVCIYISFCMYVYTRIHTYTCTYVCRNNHAAVVSVICLRSRFLYMYVST